MVKTGTESVIVGDGDKIAFERTLIDDGKFIPKHRFDCINLSLKEHKVQVAQLKEVNADLNKQVQGLICRLAETDKTNKENCLLRELLAVMLNAQSPIKE